MGIDYDMIVVPEETLEKMPKSIANHMKKMLPKNKLLGHVVYADCFAERDEWFWNSFELENEEEKREMIKKILEVSSFPDFDIYRDDYDSDEEFFEALVEDESIERVISTYMYEVLVGKLDMIYT